MKSFAAVVSTIMLLLLSGCISVPMAPLDLDIKAKQFSPVPNKASLYVYRSELYGGVQPMAITVNGRTLGQTVGETYFRLNLTPGRYNIESHAENVSGLLLTVEAGKNYFVWQEVKMGMWTGRSQLHQTDERNGRAGVMESKLIAMSISENDVIPFDTPLATPAALQAPSNDSVSQKLRELQNLRKDGLISEEEFKKKKEQLLEKL